jgi:hypothetical protein
MKVQIGDWIRVYDANLVWPDRTIEGRVVAIDNHNGFELAINGDERVRTYYRAKRKGTIAVERVDNKSENA